MPAALPKVLKLLLLAVLYLFFFRVLRAVWAEVSARPMVAAPAAAGAAAPARGTAATAPKTAMRLKVVEGDTKGKVYDLGDELTVGRAAGCQVSLADDTFVSQLHARVFRKEGR